jgi:hypothetical protein
MEVVGLNLLKFLFFYNLRLSFCVLKRRFMVEFNKLRTNVTNNLNNSESINKLLMGIKYFRIKVAFFFLPVMLILI